MSFETLIWVRTQKTGSSSQRSVLRVLADHAGQDHSCYLRTQLISDETELSPSAVRSALASLVQKGFVRIYERYNDAGARRPNRYQILIEGAETPPPDADDWAGVRQQEPEGEAPEDGGGAPASGGGTRQELEGFPIKEATSSEAPSKGGVSQPKKTATRVPDGFMPTEEMRAWFVGEGFPAVIDGRVEHEKFMDYWRACPGVKGRKLDWPATWRNWMRTAAQRAPRRPGNSLAPVSGAPHQYQSTTDAKVAQTLELGRRLQAMEDAQ